MQHFAADLHSVAHVHVAAPYYSCVQPAKVPKEAKFLTIVESLEDFTQFSFLVCMAMFDRPPLPLLISLPRPPRGLFPALLC